MELQLSQVKPFTPCDVSLVGIRCVTGDGSEIYIE